MKIDLNSNQVFTLHLGRQGETGVKTFEFDLSGLRAKYGDGVLSLSVKKSTGGDPYPVAVDVSGDTGTWVISDVDTDATGTGEAQFTYTVDWNVKKTVIYKTKVEPSLRPASQTPPDAFDDWLDQLGTIGGQIVADKEAALDAISGARSTALRDLSDSRLTSLKDIGDAKADSLSSIANAKQDALTGISGSKDSALSDISDAKDAAVSDIQEEARAASGYADAASESAENALASEQAAAGYADEARSYAENLHFSDDGTGNVIITIGG